MEETEKLLRKIEYEKMEITSEKNIKKNQSNTLFPYPEIKILLS